MTIVSSFSEPRACAACAKLEIKNTDIYFGSENGAICLLPMDTLVNLFILLLGKHTADNLY